MASQGLRKASREHRKVPSSATAGGVSHAPGQIEFARSGRLRQAAAFQSRSIAVRRQDLAEDDGEGSGKGSRAVATRV